MGVGWGPSTRVGRGSRCRLCRTRAGPSIPALSRLPTGLWIPRVFILRSLAGCQGEAEGVERFGEGRTSAGLVGRGNGECRGKRSDRVGIPLGRKHEAPVVPAEQHRDSARRELLERFAHRRVALLNDSPDLRGDLWGDTLEIALGKVVVVGALCDLREVTSPGAVIGVGDLDE